MTRQRRTNKGIARRRARRAERAKASRTGNAPKRKRGNRVVRGEQLDLPIVSSITARPPMVRAFFDSMIVDSFAGGGGASSGIELALGRSPDIAINHDPEAIAMHAANHPETTHFIESVWKVDPKTACGNRPVGLMWLSPTCIFFSKAKGTALDETAVKIRGLCWLAITWAAAVKPRNIILENVEEFEKFGPLHRQHTHGCEGVKCSKDCTFGKPKGKSKRSKKHKTHIEGCPHVPCSDACRIHKPIKGREGELFQAFVAKLRKYYRYVEWRQLRACDFGAPTSRRRLFLQASDEPIPWPVPTHGPGRKHPYRTAAEVIDWSIECPSIFDRDRDLADKTLARIARGVQKFVIDHPKPFLVPTQYGDKGGTDVRVNDIHQPMPTICGNRCGHAVVVPTVIKAKTYGGGGNDAKTANEPLSTITASKRGEHAVVAPVLMRADMHQSNASCVYPAEEPLHTITTATGGGHAVIEAKMAPYLIHRSNGERGEVVDPDGTVHPAQAPRVYDAQKPLGTIVAQGEKHAACVAMLIKHNGGHNDESGSAGQVLTKPVDTISTRDSKAVAVAHLVRYNTENSEGSARGQGMDAPVTTLDTANRLGVVSSHLVKLRGTSDAHIDASAHSMEAPIPTISAGGERGGIHFAEVETELAPLGTYTKRAREVAAFLVRYNGTGEAEDVEDPLGTLTTKDRYGLVTVEIDGDTYVIVDIRMRMLQPSELFAAQGFDPGYIIEAEHDGKPLTKTAQVRMVGNSVPPPLAAAIVRARFGLEENVEYMEAA